LPNFVNIDQFVAEIAIFYLFLNGSHRLLDFQKRKIFLANRAGEPRHITVAVKIW